MTLIPKLVNRVFKIYGCRIYVDFVYIKICGNSSTGKEIGDRSARPVALCVDYAQDIDKREKQRYYLDKR
jgi:hypothetical protein